MVSGSTKKKVKGPQVRHNREAKTTINLTKKGKSMVTYNISKVNSIPTNNTNTEHIISRAFRFLVAVLISILILSIYIYRKDCNLYLFDFSETVVAVMFVVFVRPAIIEIKVSCFIENLKSGLWNV